MFRHILNFDDMQGIMHALLCLATVNAFPGLCITVGRRGCVRAASGSRPPNGATEGGLARRVLGAVFAASSREGGADPDRPLRLQRPLGNGRGENANLTKQYQGIDFKKIISRSRRS